MSEKYWITRAQLGLLQALDREEERKKTVEEIIGNKKDLQKMIDAAEISGISDKIREEFKKEIEELKRERDIWKDRCFLTGKGFGVRKKEVD